LPSMWPLCPEASWFTWIECLTIAAQLALAGGTGALLGVEAAGNGTAEAAAAAAIEADTAAAAPDTAATMVAAMAGPAGEAAGSKALPLACDACLLLALATEMLPSFLMPPSSAGHAGPSAECAVGLLRSDSRVLSCVLTSAGVDPWTAPTAGANHAPGSCLAIGASLFPATLVTVVLASCLSTSSFNILGCDERFLSRSAEPDSACTCKAI